MLVNLPNGKTVDMPLDDYLRIGMDGYQYLMAQNLGTAIEHPFFASVLYHQGEEEGEDEPLPEEEEDDEYLPLEEFEE